MNKKVVEGLKAHALKNYGKGGWDVVVECWTDDEIAEFLVEDGPALAEVDEVKTVGQAIKAFRHLVGVWADRQADAKNSQF